MLDNASDDRLHCILSPAIIAWEGAGEAYSLLTIEQGHIPFDVPRTQGYNPACPAPAVLLPRRPANW